jgi:hypothetical protein
MPLLSFELFAWSRILLPIILAIVLQWLLLDPLSCTCLEDWEVRCFDCNVGHKIS